MNTVRHQGALSEFDKSASLTLIKPDTFTNTSGQMGSNLTLNIFWCSMTPAAVCFTVLKLFSIGKVIDHTWAYIKHF